MTPGAGSDRYQIEERKGGGGGGVKCNQGSQHVLGLYCMANIPNSKALPSSRIYTTRSICQYRAADRTLTDCTGAIWRGQTRSKGTYLSAALARENIVIVQRTFDIFIHYSSHGKRMRHTRPVCAKKKGRLRYISNVER